MSPTRSPAAANWSSRRRRRRRRSPDGAARRLLLVVHPAHGRLDCNISANVCPRRRLMTKRFTPQPTGVALALALAAVAGAANADTPGYVSDSRNQVWMSPFGQCWKTTDWSPGKAVAPCDAVQVVTAPAPVVVAVPPAPIAAAPVAPAPVIEKVTLQSDVLFEFDKAELRPAGRDELDQLAERIKDAQVES